MILVDGDVVNYRCGFAAEKTRYRVWERYENGEEQLTQFDNAKEANEYMQGLKEERSYPYNECVVTRESFQEIEPVENALHSVKTLMASIQAEFPEHDMIVFFSCPTEDNWRTKFFPQYKANRKDQRRPAHGPAIRKYMEAKYHCEDREGLEADDLISIYASQHPGSIIATNDKDLDQIAGQHYDFTKQHKYWVIPDEAFYVRELQTVMGDSTDNVPGVPGVGRVTADRYMKDMTAREVYLDFYDTEAAAQYEWLLNRALVSLPTDPEDIEIWTEEIEYARKAFEALREGSEDDMSDAGSAGDTDASEEAVEASCA
jgi:5'-3' exonuclease